MSFLPISLSRMLSTTSWIKLKSKRKIPHLSTIAMFLPSLTHSMSLELQTTVRPNQPTLNSKTICKGSVQSRRTKPHLIGGGNINIDSPCFPSLREITWQCLQHPAHANERFQPPLTFVLLHVAAWSLRPWSAWLGLKPG